MPSGLIEDEDSVGAWFYVRLIHRLRARRGKFVALITEVRTIESNDWSGGVPETAGQMS